VIFTLTWWALTTSYAVNVASMDGRLATPAHTAHAVPSADEYCERPFHGKVALIDDEWATVGSSNLDPLSLALNLEANVIIRDREFNRHLAGRLEHLIRHSCKRITREDAGEMTVWETVRSFFAFHFTRRYPGWAAWLPRHVPRLFPARDNRLQPLYENGGKR